jgi:Domain of unknown function (DUF1744)
MIVFVVFEHGSPRDADGHQSPLSVRGANVQVAYVADEAAAHARLTADLSDFRKDRRGPTLALIDAPVASVDALRRGVPPLRELPTAEVAPGAVASSAAGGGLAWAAAGDADAFESVEWQVDVPRQALARVLAWHGWLQAQLHVSRCASAALTVSRTPRLCRASCITKTDLVTSPFVFYLMPPSACRTLPLLFARGT